LCATDLTLTNSTRRCKEDQRALLTGDGLFIHLVSFQVMSFREKKSHVAAKSNQRGSTLLQEISSVDIPKASYAVASLGAATAFQNQSFESTSIMRAWIGMWF
jgi:hypothetical protein